MQCPHCEYKHGWTPNEGVVKGTAGEFYYLNHTMGTFTEGRTTENAVWLYGCPSCTKTFISRTPPSH